MRIFCPLALIFFTALNSFCAASGFKKYPAKTSFFEVYYQGKLPPAGLSVYLARIRSAIEMEMSFLGRARLNKPAKIILYENKESYYNSKYKPAKGFEALCFPSKRLVATYRFNDGERLKSILAHELAHLFFKDYFGDVEIPLWLNEGLAVKIEDKVQSGGKNSWSYGLYSWRADKAVEFKKFLPSSPGNLSAKEKPFWYLQAFGIVEYLSQTMQFKIFCQRLRARMSEKDALFKTYFISSPADFQEKWAEWLKTKNSARPEDNFYTGFDITD